MKQRSLILLGLLMRQRQHGYQINDFIEKNLSSITDMKKPTAYATLDKLNANGYIDIEHEQEGNRPPRKVYAINDKGRAYFFELLMDNLTESETYHYKGDVGLMFIDFLSQEQALKSLTLRLEKNKKMIEQYTNVPQHVTTQGVNLVIRHKLIMLQAEIQFLEEALQQLGKKHL